MNNLGATPSFIETASSRLRESYVQRRACNPKPLPQCLLDLNYEALEKRLRPDLGLLRTTLAKSLAARKLFNPHRARSGSVQRILSAMLRPGLCVISRELIAGALRIES
jgi:hypothetical protein